MYISKSDRLREQCQPTVALFTVFLSFGPGIIDEPSPIIGGNPGPRRFWRGRKLFGYDGGRARANAAAPLEAAASLKAEAVAFQAAFPAHQQRCLDLAAVAQVRNVGSYRVTGEKPDNYAKRSCADGERNLLLCHGNRKPLSPIPDFISRRRALLWQTRQPHPAADRAGEGGGSLSNKRAKTIEGGTTYARAAGTTAATLAKSCATNSRGSPRVTKSKRARRSSSGQFSSSTGGCATC